MEQFSFAYVKAVAAVADCAVEIETVDRDSIDFTLKWKSNAGRYRSPRLEAQLKATYRNCVGATEVTYPLKRKNYEELAAPNFGVPRILVVLAMPRNIEDWLGHSEAELALRRCAYWCSLRGAAPIGTRRSKVVRLPRTQVFDAQGLNQIYTRLAAGLHP